MGEEILSPEAASGLGPTFGGFQACDVCLNGRRWAGGSRVQPLPRGICLPRYRVISREIGSNWFYLGLPEPKAGARGPGASSGGGATSPSWNPLIKETGFQKWQVPSGYTLPATSPAMGVCVCV